jgi:tetratricopeptide (TPR) repeat protein
VKFNSAIKRNGSQFVVPALAGRPWPAKIPAKAGTTNWLLPIARCLLLLLFAVFTFSIHAQTKKPRAVATTKAFTQLAHRAAAAREAGHLDEALKLYQQAVQQSPKWAEGWWSLGTINYELDRYLEASEAFRRLLLLDERGGPAWALLGLSLHKLKNYQQAIACLERAAILGVGDNKELRSVANYHLAILFNRFEQYERAYEVWLRVLQDRGESNLILQGMGLTMLRLAYLPEETPPEKRELVARIGKASYLAATNERTAADTSHKEIIADFPDAAGVHYAYGVFLMRDTPDAALEAFRRELQRTPDHVPALLQLAFEHLRRNEAKEGLPHAERAAQLAPKLFVARNALGRLLLELGQTERAISELEIGVKLEANSPEMHFALARAYDRARRKADAARARAEFIRLSKLRRTEGEGTTNDSAGAPPIRPQ